MHHVTRRRQQEGRERVKLALGHSRADEIAASIYTSRRCHDSDRLNVTSSFHRRHSDNYTTDLYTIRYEMLFNVRLKADTSQLNLRHGTDNRKV